MKTATLKFLKDFYSPLHKKWFIASDPKNSSIEIDIDENDMPIHSFWHEQLRFAENKSYFELITTENKLKKAK